METKFQTSFIPKKNAGNSSLGAARQVSHHTTSVYMVIAVVVFVASLAGIGGAYAWTAYLNANLDGYKNDLAAREKQFDVDTIQTLKQENVRIDLAKQVLSKHLALSQIFAIVGKLTIASVRFLSMDVSVPANASDGVKVTLSGYGSNLASVAFQSDVLGNLEQYNLRKVVKNPIMSNPSLDPKGTVSFSLTAVIDAGNLLYEQPTVAVGTSTSP
jgi:hypothetical protein